MKFVTLTLFAVVLAAPVARADAAATPPQKAVLVTGASTGIGRMVTERLAASGYFVYAGARKDKDLTDLSAIKNVQGVRLDVTKPEDVAAAVETVNKGGRGLYALVNNAGVVMVGPLMQFDERDTQFVMDVNVFGVMRVTQAFYPLIQKEKGRVINIGSISGILAERVAGVYQMSKHAIEAYTDVLAVEVAPSGVAVSVVEPGSYHTEIRASALKYMTEAASDPKHAPADPELLKRVKDRSETKFKEPDEVAEAVKRALTDEKPQRRYMVVPSQDEAEITIKKQLEQLVQLNQNQAYAYGRDDLVKMLDAAIADQRR